MRLVSQQLGKGSGRYPQPGNRVWSAPAYIGHGWQMATTASTRQWYRKRYRLSMAMNLRLPGELAARLRELSEETGRSQQELAREALEEYVRDYRLRNYPKEVRHLITPAARPGQPLDPELLDKLRSIGRDRLLSGLEEVRADKV